VSFIFIEVNIRILTGTEMGVNILIYGFYNC